MDWSEKTSCIKCDNGGTLLVCSENGCPLAVHEGCLGCPAKFDDLGCFYCPYCLYKQAVAELRKAREFALARKKALLVFMDDKKYQTGENKICEENGHNQSKTIVEANGNIASSDNGKSKLNNAEEDFEDSDDSSGSKGEDPSLEVHGEESNRTEEEKKVEEEEPETSAGEEQIQEENRESSAEEEQIQEEKRETSSEEFQYLAEEWETSVEKEQIQEEKRETSVEKEQIQEEKRETSVEKEEEERETSSASPDHDSSLTQHPRAKRGSKRCQPVDKDSDADPVRSKRLKKHGKKKQTSTTVTPTTRSSRKSPVVMRTTGNVLKEEVRSTGRLKKLEEFSFKIASDVLDCAKRKRLKWTEIEEETLRAGVEKYSGGAKTLPWRAILDFGCGKFDATRTPGDLKGKWRNMLGRPR